MLNELRTMHLFAGHGGGLLADLILGHTPVVAVEWDRYACQVLRERAADGWFPGLSVWEGDVRMFDPSEYAGSVDVVHAGFPCQDISVAGRQAGVGEGTRSGLYREVLRIAGVVGPRYLFLENVAAILGNGLGTVLADLAALGYDARWLCIRASDVGAPHHRDRWFLLANASQLQRNGGNDYPSIGVEGGEIPELGNRGWEKDVAYANGAQRQGNRSALADGTENCAVGRFSWWESEPQLGRVANGIPNRVEQLKGYGNAQVPLQAAAAWRLLGGH